MHQDKEAATTYRMESNQQMEIESEDLVNNQPRSILLPKGPKSKANPGRRGKFGNEPEPEFTKANTSTKPTNIYSNRRFLRTRKPVDYAGKFQILQFYFSTHFFYLHF